MSVPCGNCGRAVRGEGGPRYCPPCRKAITLAVEYVGGKIAAAILREMADEAEGSVPRRLTLVGGDDDGTLEEPPAAAGGQVRQA